MIALPLIIFFILLAGFLVIGFFVNIYKTIYWGVGNLVGYGVATAAGYFLCTPFISLIIDKIPMDLPFKFDGIIEPILFLIMILVILAIWNLVILLPLYIFVFRRLVKKGKIHLKESKSKTKKILFRFGSAALMGTTLLPFNALATTSIATGIEMTEDWDGIKTYDIATRHIKDMTFTTLGNLNANDYWQYVGATNALVSILKSDAGFGPLMDLYSSIDNIGTFSGTDPDGFESYCNQIFDTSTPADGVYPTQLSETLGSDELGNKLHAIFASSVYQQAFEDEIVKMIPTAQYTVDEITAFNAGYDHLIDGTGIEDGETGNYFKMSNEIVDTNYLIVGDSMFDKLKDTIIKKTEDADIDVTIKEQFAQNYAHMFAWVEPQLLNP